MRPLTTRETAGAFPPCLHGPLLHTRHVPRFGPNSKPRTGRGGEGGGGPGRSGGRGGSGGREGEGRGGDLPIPPLPLNFIFPAPQSPRSYTKSLQLHLVLLRRQWRNSTISFPERGSKRKQHVCLPLSVLYQTNGSPGTTFS